MRPDGAGSTKEEEYRLSVALLPLRLRIDQNMVTFLQGFFAPSDPNKGAKETASSKERASNSSAAQETEGEGVTLSRECQGHVTPKQQMSNLALWCKNLKCAKQSIERTEMQSACSISLTLHPRAS